MGRELLSHGNLEPYLNGRGDLTSLEDSLRGDFYSAINALKTTQNPGAMVLVVMTSAADLYRRGYYLPLGDERQEVLFKWAGRLQEAAEQTAENRLGINWE